MKQRNPRTSGASRTDLGMDARYRGVAMMSARWQVQWTKGYKMPEGANMPSMVDIHAKVLEYRPQYHQIYDWVTQHRYPHARRLFTNAKQWAVIAENLAFCPDEAMEFWRSAIRGTGGGSVVSYRTRLAERTPRSAATHYAARLAAQAWNRRNFSSTLNVPDAGPI